MKTPKILILIMSCNKEFFIKSEDVIKNTYLTLLDKYSNIDYYFFTAYKCERIDTDNHKIFVNTGDDWTDTFNKNKRVFEIITEAGIEYDYIVRVNTSVYLNIELLDNLCKYLYATNDSHIYCGEINRYNNHKYPVGKCIIFNKLHIDKIINSSIEVTNDPDDAQYGKIFDDDIYRLIKCAYYNYYSNHYLNISKLDINIMKDNIFLSYKYVSGDRNIEYKEAYDIHNILKDYKYNPLDLKNALSLIQYHVFDHNAKTFMC